MPEVLPQAEFWPNRVGQAGQMRAWVPSEWPLAQGWSVVVEEWLRSEPGKGLSTFLVERLNAGACIYPPLPFQALADTALSDVKVVILGQDPYHGPGQAEGLSFSVAPGVKVPPSLRNIFKELLREEFVTSMPANGSLRRWAKNGVLLLNTCLTVEAGQPASHAKKGWEALTDALIAQVAMTSPACVYMLWGAHAQAKASLIEDASRAAATDCLILQSNHPSPLSALRPPAPFVGNAHFSKAQAWLGERGHVLDWAL